MPWMKTDWCYRSLIDSYLYNLDFRRSCSMFPRYVILRPPSPERAFSFTVTVRLFRSSPRPAKQKQNMAGILGYLS